MPYTELYFFKDPDGSVETDFALHTFKPEE